MFGSLLVAIGAVSLTFGVGLIAAMAVTSVVSLPLLAVALGLYTVGLTLVYFGLMSKLDEECKRFVNEVIAKISFDWEAPPYIPFTLTNIATIEASGGTAEGLSPNDYKIYVDYGTGTYLIDFTVGLQIDAERSLKSFSVNAFDLLNKPGEIFADFVKTEGKKSFGNLNIDGSVFQSISSNTTDDAINSVMKKFVRLYVEPPNNNKYEFESIEAILQFPGGLVVGSNTLKQGIDSVLSRLYLLPLSRNLQAVKFYLFVMIKDGTTGAIKYADMRRFSLPLAIFRVRGWCKACQICGKQSIYWTAPYYFISLLDGDKINVRFIGTSKYPIKPGDLVEIWVGSPYLFYAIKWYCCDYCGYTDPLAGKCKNGVSPCPRDEKCREFCNVVMAGKQGMTGNICTAEACSSGEILFPRLFVNFMRNVGFYNEDIVKMAKLLANTGFIVPLVEGGVPLRVENFIPVGDFTVSMEGFMPSQGRVQHVSCSVDMTKLASGDKNAVSGENCKFLSKFMTVRKVGNKLYVNFDGIDSILMFRYIGPRGGVSANAYDIGGKMISLLVDPGGDILSDTGFGIVALGALGTREKVLFLPFVQNLNGPQAIWALPDDPNCYNVEVDGTNVTVTLNPNCPVVKNLDRNSTGYRLLAGSASALGYLLSTLMSKYRVGLEDIVSMLPAINAIKIKARENEQRMQSQKTEQTKESRTST